MPLLLWRKQWKEIKLKLTTDRFAGASWFPLSVKKCLLFEINSKGCRIHILNYSLVPGTLWSLKRHYVCHFPAIAFVTFLPFRLSFSATLRLSFSHHCILIFPPFPSSFFRHCVRLFPPFCLSFSRHCIRHFSAIAFVTFPPLRSSVATLPPLPAICHHVRTVRHLLACRLIILSLGHLRLSFSCHYVRCFSPEGLSWVLSFFFPPSCSYLPRLWVRNLSHSFNVKAAKSLWHSPSNLGGKLFW